MDLANVKRSEREESRSPLSVTTNGIDRAALRWGEENEGALMLPRRGGGGWYAAQMGNGGTRTPALLQDSMRQQESSVPRRRIPPVRGSGVWKKPPAQKAGGRVTRKKQRQPSQPVEDEAEAPYFTADELKELRRLQLEEDNDICDDSQDLLCHEDLYDRSLWREYRRPRLGTH